MASRRVALVSAQKGPWIATRQVRNPQAHCSGPQGKVRVLVRSNDLERHFEAVVPGVFDLPHSEWMQVEFLGSDPKGLIVTINSKRVIRDAVSAA